MTARQDFRSELIALIASLIPTIGDDYRVTDDPHDETPGILLTVGADNGGWGYQTGDASYSGAAYNFRYWGQAGIYRDSNPEVTADELLADLESNADDHWPFFYSE